MSTSAEKNRGRAKIIRGAAASSAASALDNKSIGSLVGTTTQGMNAAQAFEFQRKVALEQGYSAGLEKARDEVGAAMADSNKRVQRALAALCDAVDAFDLRQAVALRTIEAQVVDSALQIAAAVLQHEVSVAVRPGVDAIARAMALAPYKGNVLARLNPEDAATLSTDSVSTTTRTVEVIADPTVEPGGCIVEVGETRIDAQMTSVLENVRAVLMSGLTDSEIEAAGSSSPSSGTTASEAPLV